MPGCTGVTLLSNEIQQLPNSFPHEPLFGSGMPACWRIISQRLHRNLAWIWSVSHGQESNKSMMSDDVTILGTTGSKLLDN